jgi:type II secretory pathway component PulM
MYTTSEPPRSTAMLSFGMIGAIVLILAIVFVQFLENKRAKKQQEKLEKQNAAAAETEAEIDKNRV